MGKVKGSCLCGGVEYECENNFKQFHFCHCTQCQKLSGSAHVANLFTRKDNIHWVSGKEKVKRYDVPGRSISAAFCQACGSPVPYISSSGKSLIVPAGGLDGVPNMNPQDNIFWAERACWYEEGVTSRKYDAFPV